MTAPILVGLRLEDPYRQRNWSFSRCYWEETLGWPIYEGHHDGPDPFCMSLASNRAAELAGDWDVAFYVGADFFLDDPGQALRAVELAAETGRLTFAHEVLVQLDERETAKLVAAQLEHGSRALVPAAAGGYLHPAGVRHKNTFSGALAIPRPLWDKVGGFDERFVGWGYEDIAFWCACLALGGGFERIPGTMYHLWHPRERSDNEEQPDFPANQVLGNRYLAAKGNRAAMQAILAER